MMQSVERSVAEWMFIEPPHVLRGVALRRMTLQAGNPPPRQNRICL